MLKNIDPILTPEVLYALCSMGRGDEVIIVDSHYPAEMAARNSTWGKLLRMDGGDSAAVTRAILSVLELDHMFVKQPAERMMVDNEPNTIPNLQAEIDTATGRPLPMAGVPRRDYYKRSKKAFCVVIIGETRGCGCFILKKGLITTPGQPAKAGNSHISQYKVKPDEYKTSNACAI